MSRPIAVIGAMDKELTALLAELQSQQDEAWHEFTFYQGQLWGREAVVAKTGVGKVFAAMVTQHLIDIYQPRAIIFSGVAGALNPKYQIGDIVVATDCIQHDMDVRVLGYERGQIPESSYKEFVCDEGLVQRALKTKLSQVKMYSGRVLSGDQFVSQSQRPEFKYLRAELKGDAVEMEGAAVGQVCAVNEVPFVIIRTISDRADQAAPDDYQKFVAQVVKNSLAVVKQLLVDE